MAWIGLVAVFGLVICLLDAIVDAARSRGSRRGELSETSPRRRRR